MGDCASGIRRSARWLEAAARLVEGDAERRARVLRRVVDRDVAYQITVGLYRKVGSATLTAGQSSMLAQRRPLPSPRSRAYTQSSTKSPRAATTSMVQLPTTPRCARSC